MIALERVRTEQAIRPNFRGDKPVERLLDLMRDARAFLADGKAIDLKIRSAWAETKDQLLAESRDKCAYCESHFGAVAFGDVEHYRPKSLYWWLAYVYDNYLPSCAICNQRHKGAKFAFAGEAMPRPAFEADATDDDLRRIARTAIPDPLDAEAVDRFRTAHAAESPLIPNPYFDDPERFLGWKVLADIGEVIVVPREGIEGAAAIVAACEEIYGLNRAQLKRRRFAQYQTYRIMLSMIADLPADAPSRALGEDFIASMQAPESEYAAMVRYLEARRTGA